MWYKKRSFLDKLIAIDEIGGFAVPKTEAIIRERLVPSEASHAQRGRSMPDLDDDQTLTAFIVGLQDSHNAAFDAAVKRLKQRGSNAAVDALISALRQRIQAREVDTPAIVAKALAKIGNPVAIPPLIEAMGSNNRGANLIFGATEPRYRGAIEKALVQFGAPAISPLISALSNEDWNVRAGAVNVLSAIGRAAVVPLLKELNDGHGISRHLAAEALGRIGDVRAVDPLISALSSDDHEFIAAACSAIAHFAGRKVLNILLELTRHPDVNVRSADAIALARFEDSKATESLISLLKDDSDDVSYAAQNSLIELGKRSIRPLATHLRALDEFVRVRSGDALAKIGRVALRPLFDALEDPDAHVRASAAWSLGAFQGRKSISRDAVVAHLLSALDDPDFRVRKASAMAFGRLYGNPAVPPKHDDINVKKIVRSLSILVKKNSEPVRLVAAESLLEVAKDPTSILRALRHRNPHVRHAMVTAICKNLRVTDPELVNTMFPRWCPLDTALSREHGSKAARALINVLAQMTHDPEPHIRLASRIALETIVTKLRALRQAKGNEIGAYNLTSTPGKKSVEEQMATSAIEKATSDEAAAAKAYRQNQEPARFTDLTIYAGFLYAGDDLAGETRLSDELPLVAGEPYTLEVAVRRKRTGIGAQLEAPAAGNPREDKEDLSLFILAEPQWSGIQIEEPFARVNWPYSRDSESAFFRLQVNSVEGREPTQGIIEVRLYDRALDLLDVVDLTVTVVPEGSEVCVPQVPARSLVWPDQKRGSPKFDLHSPPRELSIDVSFDTARLEYRLLFKFRRSSQTDPVEIPGYTAMTTTDIEDLLVSVRDFWTDLVITNYAESITVTRSRFSQYLSSLRELGMRAWMLLFGSRYAARKGASETISELLQEMELKEGIHIQIISRAVNFLFPWSILHPPVPDSEPVDPLQFWGARYQIEQVTEGPKHDLLNDEPINVAFVLDRAFGNSEEQVKLFQKYEVAAQKKLVVTKPISDEMTFFQELSRKPSAHLVYCYCHGYCPAGPGIMRRDGVKVMKEHIENLKPDTPERQALETLLELTATMGTESWMYIGDAEVREGRLNRQKFFEKRRPIVFLNMCESAELLPSMSCGLARVFLDHNASAVVGTECPMTAVFASAFAERLFDSLFGGDDVGTSLLKARRYFLDQQRNPLGLAYSLYGRAVARLGVSAILPTSGNTEPNSGTRSN